jgi:hypothetical protein
MDCFAKSCIDATSAMAENAQVIFDEKAPEGKPLGGANTLTGTVSIEL